MELYKLIEDEANKAIGYIIAIIIGGLLTFFRNVPKFYKEQKSKKYISNSWERASKISNIIQDLADHTGALYVHVIRYHNGGPQRMTIDFEAIGRNCDGCVTPCRLGRRVSRIQPSWQSAPLSSWGIYNAKRILEEKHVDLIVEEIKDIQRDIFVEYGIATMKQTFIVNKGKEFYVLSVSFCSRLKNISGVDGIISKSALQLSILL